MKLLTDYQILITMNRKFKIELLKQVEKGNFEALEALQPSIILISKNGDMYESINLSDKPNKTYTQDEYDKLVADNKNKTILLFKDYDHVEKRKN